MLHFVCNQQNGVPWWPVFPRIMLAPVRLGVDILRLCNTPDAPPLLKEWGKVLEHIGFKTSHAFCAAHTDLARDPPGEEGLKFMLEKIRRAIATNDTFSRLHRLADPRSDDCRDALRSNRDDALNAMRCLHAYAVRCRYIGVYLCDDPCSGILLRRAETFILCNNMETGPLTFCGNSTDSSNSAAGLLPPQGTDVVFRIERDLRARVTTAIVEVMLPPANSCVILFPKPLTTIDEHSLQLKYPHARIDSVPGALRLTMPTARDAMLAWQVERLHHPVLRDGGETVSYELVRSVPEQVDDIGSVIEESLVPVPNVRRARLPAWYRNAKLWLQDPQLRKELQEVIHKLERVQARLQVAGDDAAASFQWGCWITSSPADVPYGKNAVADTVVLGALEVALDVWCQSEQTSLARQVCALIQRLLNAHRAHRWTVCNHAVKELEARPSFATLHDIRERLTEYEVNPTKLPFGINEGDKQTTYFRQSDIFDDVRMLASRVQFTIGKPHKAVLGDDGIPTPLLIQKNTLRATQCLWSARYQLWFYPRGSLLEMRADELRRRGKDTLTRIRELSYPEAYPLATARVETILKAHVALTHMKLTPESEAYEYCVTTLKAAELHGWRPARLPI